MLTFEKTKAATSSSDFRVYVYKHKKTSAVQIIFRLARQIIDEAGWFVGDHAIPSLDDKSRQWVLARTADKSKGYMISSTDKSAGKSVYLKVTVSADVADRAVPGGDCDCRLLAADSRSIVGGF